VFVVKISAPLNVIIFPGLAGPLGLIVATSNAGVALAAILTGGGGGPGIAQLSREGLTRT